MDQYYKARLCPALPHTGSQHSSVNTGVDNPQKVGSKLGLRHQSLYLSYYSNSVFAKWLCPYLIKWSIASGSASKNPFILEITVKIKYTFCKSILVKSSTGILLQFTVITSWGVEQVEYRIYSFIIPSKLLRTQAGFFVNKNHSQRCPNT